MVGVLWAAGNAVGVFVTEDAGTTWTACLSSSDYRRAALAGDNPDVIYLWGVNGAIGYSQDFGETIDDRTGNIGDFSPGELIGIAGL